MQNEKEQIKRWLKKIGKDRNWLADKCYVGKRAIDKWLSTARNIPSAKLALIRKLMEEKEETLPIRKSSYPILNGVASVPVLLDPEQLEAITWAANELGIQIEEFIQRAAINDADNFAGKESTKKKIPAAQSGGKMYSAPGAGICSPLGKAEWTGGLSECDDPKRGDCKPT